VWIDLDPPWFFYFSNLFWRFLFFNFILDFNFEVRIFKKLCITFIVFVLFDDTIYL